jgi:hypothetical protein
MVEHSITTESLPNADSSTNESRTTSRWLNHESITCPFITAWEPKTEHYLKQFDLVFCVFVATGICLPNRCLAVDYSGFQAFWHTRYHGNMLSEALPSNRLFRLSGVMSQYIQFRMIILICYPSVSTSEHRKEASWQTIEEVKNDIRTDLS